MPSQPSLRERGQNDSVGSLYEQMAESGELDTYPGVVTDVAAFIVDFQRSLSGEYVIMAAGDRFRKAELLQACFESGVSWDNLQFRGTGSSAVADGSHDVRAFQRRCATGGFRPAGGVSLAAEYAISESWLRFDVGGNPSLTKNAIGRESTFSALWF